MNRSLASLVLVTVGLFALSEAGRVHAQLEEEEKLVSNDVQSFDSLGYSCSISGDTLLLCAPDEDPGGKNAAGSAYVFVRSGGAWSQQAKLVASDAAAGDKFGAFVQLQGDTAVLSSWRNDHSGLTDAGAAYVFVRSGTTWTEQAKLTASDAGAGDTFYGIALDGDTVVVGALWDDHSGLTDAGSAYVFVRSGTTWTEQAKLVASDAAAGDWFGWSIGLEADTAVISAPNADHSGLTDAGAVYVFVRSGTSWTEQAKLTASDADSLDWLGAGVNNVSLSADTVAVGAAKDDHGGFNNAGSAYVFVRSGTTWSEQAKLVASDASSGDWFAWGVSVSGDRALVGSPQDDDAGSKSGSAYLFVRSGTTWTERTKLLASDGSSGDQLGVSVAMSADIALVGAWQCQSGGVPTSGGAYTFCLAEAAASFRNGGSNPASYTCNVPLLGGTFSATVDLSTTGHSFAQLVARTTPIDVALPGGQHVLCSGPSLGTSALVPGPVAVIDVPIPATSALCGLSLTTQALHIGGVMPFSLSNAQDLVVGH